MFRRSMAIAAAAVMVLSVGGTAWAANGNGSGGDMPAYYDAQLFTINFKLLKPTFTTIRRSTSSTSAIPARTRGWISSP